MGSLVARLARLVAVGVGAVVLAGCASPGDGADTADDPADPARSDLTGELTIAAAASLAGAFDELVERFADAHPGVDVQPVRYDGSSTLATQIVEGVPVDVFASADEATMARVVDAGLAGGAEPFATNTLVLVVPAGNPGGVEGLADLADPDLAVVLCAPEVPCGAASETLLANEDVTASVDSAEQSVTAVLTKVEAGEADAGLVYVTDAATTDAVDAIDVDGAQDVVNTYPIVALDDAADADVADAFVAFVLGGEGRAVLEELDFGAP